MKLLRTILIVGIASAFAASAVAQGFGGGGGGQRRGGGMFGSGPGALLARSEVQAELKLTDDEKSKLTDLNDKVNQDRRDMFQNSNGDFQAAMADMRKKQPEWDKQYMGLLTADQQKRLTELVVQREGNSIALDANYQKDIGITDDQKAKLKDLQDKQQEAMQALMEKMRNQEITGEEMRASMTKNQQTMKDEIDKILTDDEKAKIKTMMGAPFKFQDDNGGGGGGR